MLGFARPRRESSVIRVLGSWEGPEIDVFRAVVKPFEDRTGYSVVVSTTRDLKGALERSFEVGDPPDLAGLPGPGYMLELVRKGRLVEPHGCHRHRDLPVRDRAGLRRHRDGGGQARRRLHEGDGEGPLLVQPRGHSAGQARDVGRPPARRRDRSRRYRALVHRARVRRRVGLAGHGLDRGLRPAPEWAPGLRRLGRGPGSLVIAGDSPRLPELRDRRQRRGCRRRRRGGPANALQPCRRRALHRAAQVPVRPPGHVHVHLSRRAGGRSTAVATTSSRSRTSSRASAAPSSPPGTCSR